MSETPYTAREIEILFKSIDQKLDLINNEIKSTNKHFDARISKLEDKVDDLEGFQTKAMTLWAVVVTGIGFLLNRFI